MISQISNICRLEFTKLSNNTENMPTVDYSYPIFGDNSSVGFERRKTIEQDANVSIKFAGKHRGHYNVKLVGTMANIAQAKKLLDEAVERSRAFHESTRTHRTKRREHFEAPMVSETPTQPSPKPTYRNTFAGLLDSDDEAVDAQVMNLSEPPKKLSKKERQARNKAAKGAKVDVSKQLTGPIAALKKHKWEQKKAIEEQNAKEEAAAQKAHEEARWQNNPRFGELTAQVQLFDSQVDGKHIGQIFIGDSGLAYFAFEIEEGEEYQIMLDTTKNFENYTARKMLYDKSDSHTHIDTEVLENATIEVIVEKYGEDEVHGGNAWIIRSEEELQEQFKAMNEFEVLDWAEEPLCA